MFGPKVHLKWCPGFFSGSVMSIDSNSYCLDVTLVLYEYVRNHSSKIYWNVFYFISVYTEQCLFMVIYTANVCNQSSSNQVSTEKTVLDLDDIYLFVPSDWRLKDSITFIFLHTNHCIHITVIYLHVQPNIWLVLQRFVSFWPQYYQKYSASKSRTTSLAVAISALQSFWNQTMGWLFSLGGIQEVVGLPSGPQTSQTHTEERVEGHFSCSWSLKSDALQLKQPFSSPFNGS